MDSCLGAFEAIKSDLSTSPVLVLPDQSKHFTLVSDACQTPRAVGAVCCKPGPLPIGRSLIPCACRQDILRVGSGLVSPGEKEPAQLKQDANGLWWTATNQLMVPNYGRLRYEMFESVHVHPFSGHYGQSRTQKKALQLNFLPSMAEDLKAWCQKCDSCQWVKAESVQTKRGTQSFRYTRLQMGVCVYGPHYRSSGDKCCDIYAHYACVADCANAMADAWEDTAGCAHADCLHGNILKC